MTVRCPSAVQHTCSQSTASLLPQPALVRLEVLWPTQHRLSAPHPHPAIRPAALHCLWPRGPAHSDSLTYLDNLRIDEGGVSITAT